MLNQEAIEEFKELWLKEYGRKIDDKKAQAIGAKLLKIMKATYQQMPNVKTKVAGK